MTSRLRRMFLINTRTSGTATSASIAELDPRGGAAIVGLNGAGKTTTLQILPLFLGCSPNQIAPPSGTRDPIMRYVCPTQQSAICFEYQRGDAPEDIHLAVLRRQDSNDSPEYRFFNTPFRDELFIAPSPDGDGEVFLDDEASVQAALSLGITSSQKLVASQYRAIILNNRTLTKDADVLRRIAREYSFSKRPLPHLDRLLATVIRDHIDFKDFTAVAVSMVFEQLGGAITPQGQHQKLAVKQGEGQINLWLSNRDASERALQLRPTVEALRKHLDEHTRVMYQLGSLRGKVQTLHKTIVRYLEDEQSLYDAREADFKDFSETAHARVETLSNEVSDSFEKHAEAERTYLAAKARKDYLYDSSAEHHAIAALKLPELEAESHRVTDQLKDIDVRSSGVERDFEPRIRRHKEQTQKASRKMEDGKKPFTDTCEAEILQLQRQEKDECTAINQEADVQASEFDAQLENLNQDLGEARTRARSPQAPQPMLERVETSRKALDEHQSHVFSAMSESHEYEGERKDAVHAFDAAEFALTTAKTQKALADQELQDATLALTPGPNSFHASLLANPSEGWRSNLARVIRPELLREEGLKPYYTGEDTGTLYGWSIAVDTLRAPDWIQDDVLRERLSTAESTQLAARAEVERCTEALRLASEALRAAEAKASESKAQYDVLHARTRGLQHDLTEAEEARNKGIEGERNRAYDLFKELSAQKERITADKEKLATHTRKQLADKEAEFQIAREQASARRDLAHRQIDEQIKQFNASQKFILDDIIKERDGELKAKGLDPEDVTRIRKRSDQIAEAMSEIYENAALVSQWNRWLREEGPNHVAALEGEAIRLANVHDEWKAKRTEHTRDTERRVEAHRLTQQKARAAKETAIGERDALDGMNRQLMDYAPRFDANVPPDTLAVTLRGELKTLNDSLLNVNRRIDSEFSKIKGPLFATESSVKAFFQACLNDLDESANTVIQATRIISAYERLGREVIVHVNSELSTILAHIGQFRSRITAFESEVKAFNKKLQTGLDGVVVGFDSIQDFKISIVSDFTQLDFMSKLSALDDVIRVHRAMPRAEYQTHVPPQTASLALRDFMGVLSNGALEIDLSQHVTLSGSVSVQGAHKVFKRESELKNLSSNGISSIALITLLCGMLNVIRGTEPIHFPWISDEVGKFDGGNFSRLMDMLKENRIDVITASPSLTPAGYAHFQQRYLLGSKGSVATYRQKRREATDTAEVTA